MKDIRSLNKLIENSEYSTHIRLYFGTLSTGVGYNPRRHNYTETVLNPITIKGYVREVSFASLVWKQYGLDKIGIKEITCKKEYRTQFETCAKIEIDSEIYTPYKKAGGKCLIQEIPGNLMKIVVEKK